MYWNSFFISVADCVLLDWLNSLRYWMAPERLYLRSIAHVYCIMFNPRCEVSKTASVFNTASADIELLPPDARPVSTPAPPGLP